MLLWGELWVLQGRDRVRICELYLPCCRHGHLDLLLGELHRCHSTSAGAAFELTFGLKLPTFGETGHYFSKLQLALQ